jgi:hypothetical protein
MNDEREDAIIFKEIDNIKIRDMKTLKEITLENEDILGRIIDKFSYYKNNSFDKIMQVITDWELTVVESLDELYTSDVLFMLDLHRFYNLNLRYMGIFIGVKDDKIKTIINSKKRRTTTNNTDNKIFFRSLSSKDKLKMKLYEILN